MISMLVGQLGSNPPMSAELGTSLICGWVVVGPPNWSSIAASSNYDHETEIKSKMRELPSTTRHQEETNLPDGVYLALVRGT